MSRYNSFDPSVPTVFRFPYSYEAVRENRRELAFWILSNPGILDKPQGKKFSSIHKEVLGKKQDIGLYARWVRAEIRKIECDTGFITEAQRIELYDRLKFTDAMIAFGSNEQARNEILRAIQKFQDAMKKRNLSLQ